MDLLTRSLRGPVTESPFESIARAVPAILYMGVIFLGSAIPGDDITIRIDDRVAHFLEYALLGALLVFFASSLKRGTTLGAAVAIVAFVALHAVADEFHQSFVPGREPSAKDWMFDMAGATTAVVFLRAVAARESR